MQSENSRADRRCGNQSFERSLVVAEAHYPYLVYVTTATRLPQPRAVSPLQSTHAPTPAREKSLNFFASGLQQVGPLIAATISDC